MFTTSAGIVGGMLEVEEKRRAAKTEDQVAGERDGVDTLNVRVSVLERDVVVEVRSLDSISEGVIR